MTFTRQAYEIWWIIGVTKYANGMTFMRRVYEICLISGVTEYANGMTFTRQVYEICLISGVTEYANGMIFRCFQGGFFLPCELHSGLGVRKKPQRNYGIHDDERIPPPLSRMGLVTSPRYFFFYFYMY